LKAEAMYESHDVPSNRGPISIVFSNDGHRYRRTRNPGDDLSDLPQEAQDSINAIWTPGYVSGWQTEMAQLEADFAAEKLAARAQAVKAEAKRRIIAIKPEYAQRNTLAKGQEMMLAHGPDRNFLEDVPKSDSQIL